MKLKTIYFSSDASTHTRRKRKKGGAKPDSSLHMRGEEIFGFATNGFVQFSRAAEPDSMEKKKRKERPHAYDVWYV